MERRRIQPTTGILRLRPQDDITCRSIPRGAPAATRLRSFAPILGAQERFADEDRVHASFEQHGDVFRARDAAFGDEDTRGWYQRPQPWRERDVGDQGVQVAVVHADDTRASGQGAFDFGCGVGLDEGLHAARVSQLEQLSQQTIRKCPHDEQDSIRAQFACLQDLVGIDHEVLA